MRHAATVAKVLVAAVAVAAYATTVNDYFVQDDFGVVWLLSKKPADAFFGWFVHPWMDDIWGFIPDEIRPFPALSYQLAAALGPGWPLPNHVVNIAFHAGTALLVWAVARRVLGLELPAATFAAVVFALLPNQAETVAWVTGRVDSMPALFYIASFLTYAQWRTGAGTRFYAWSILWLIVALFTKQNTITLGPAIVLYDLIVARRPLAVRWAWLRPYVPFIVLTAAYLGLRYLQFGEVAREGHLNAASITGFLRSTAGHVMRVVIGANALGPSGVALALASTAALAAYLTGGLRTGTDLGRSVRAVAYFGVVWMALGLAPTLVSGYVSPRHAYLASAGWALSAGIVVDALWHAQAPRLARAALAFGAVLLLGSYSVQLQLVLREWSARSTLSHKAVAALEYEADRAPEGTLFVVGVPPITWAWALPFVAKPPFTRTDLTERVFVIGEAKLYCCPADQWNAATRAHVQAWLDHPSHPPVIAMHWDADTGRLARLSDVDDPALRTATALLLQTSDAAGFDWNLRRLLQEFVAVHRAATRQ